MFKTYKPYAYTLVWLYAMVAERKREPETTRTTLVIETKLWKNFLSYVVQKHGTARKISIEAEAAIREYLERHEPKAAP